MRPTAKTRKGKNKLEKRARIAVVLEKLAAAVRAGKYGSDGCGNGPKGYCVSDDLSDYMDGYDIEK